MDLEFLALAVDEHLCCMPPGTDPARLFVVRRRGDLFFIAPLWSGVARELPSWVVPGPGALAIALETDGWVAPLGEGRPSLHPLRRRVHQTVLIGGDGEDVSVLRHDDGEPRLLRGAVGMVPELLLACWARRLDASASF